MSLNPIKTTEEIVRKYIDYITTTFSFKNQELEEKFQKTLNQPNKLSKGPILEATPPFQKGSSINELIDNGTLVEEFRKLDIEKELPLDRTLYLHQEEAIKKVVLENRNIIVATGTGSGKTESFLIPILNHLFEQKIEGRLTPGVRALLLYPMNALANDQLKRLRKLLKNYEYITFGSYTGETPEFYNTALDKYMKLHDGQEPLKNELISRDKMKEEPPHILLTNYAMLEYLMLRPEDHIFFDGSYSDQWKFIVIDEAHTYTGAQAIEMSMLLRRLKRRIYKKDSNIRCIATSATIGKDKADYPLVADFGQKLFGEKFEYIQDDISRQDVVSSTKIKNSDNISAWGMPDMHIYSKLYETVESYENDSKDLINKMKLIAMESGVPDKIIRKAIGESNGSWRNFLYIIMSGDSRVIELQSILEQSPKSLNELVKILLNNKSDIQELVDMVNLANKAKAGDGYQPLIPARYHLFLRAIEGAFISFQPEIKISLERKNILKIGEKKIPVFEVASCRQCKSLYLVGEREKDNNRDKYIFKQPGKAYYEDRGNLEYYLVLDDGTDKIMDNEDELVSGGNYDSSGYYLLCPECGAIEAENLFGTLCECHVDYIKLLKVSAKAGLVHKCPACGSISPQGSIIWRFLLGNDAVTSVLATSLYQQLPPIKIKSKEKNNINDLWSSNTFSESQLINDYKKEARQLLAFSDSRQDAAFFATYLENTYTSIVRKQIILRVINENKDSVIKNRWSIKDLVSNLKTYLSKIDLYPGMSLQQIEDISWKWSLYEFLSLEGRNSLESLGLLTFSLRRPSSFAAQPLRVDPWNLTEEETWNLFRILLEGFRKYGAVLFPDNISPRDDFFKPRNREYYFKGRSTGTNIYSWSPSSKGVLNSRLDYLMKLADRVGNNLSREECELLLNQIWDKALAIGIPNSPFKNYFSSLTDRRTGTLYRIKLDYWDIQPGLVNRKINWYYCPICKRITHYNVKNVCPTYRCNGVLEACNPHQLYKDNHYRKLYLSRLPEKMRAEEHTAQLTTDAAADIQEKFNEGDVNLLSCSTTFELGVDVGELESVFMRNVPPTASNYIQRAGRAGRRVDSTAFALTYARRRSHDLSNYNNPLLMVNGEIKPPYFELSNPKIIKRHLFAIALSFFWQENPGYFGTVEDFFFHEGVTGPDLFKEYLLNKPQDLKDYIIDAVPSEMHNLIDVQNWGWFDDLYNQDYGVMFIANQQLISDISQLEKVKDENAAQDNYYKAGVINKNIGTIKRRYLINFMSQNNIIPKYGFPVDVVNLQINHHGDIAHNLDLSRDLKIALSEYAPSSEVIAGGKLWTSRYLKKLPDRELLKYDYAICDNCGNYQSKLHEIGEVYRECDSCGKKLGRSKGIFIRPEFGFISEKPKKPAMVRPQRTYSTRLYFTGESDDENISTLNFNGIKVKLAAASNGKMAVINHAGYRQFSICTRCGHASLHNGKKQEKNHKTPWGSECKGRRERISLGHEFFTDIFQVRFIDSYFGQGQKGFWNSVLYGMLEGISSALGIERRDIDGCLYSSGDPYNPSLVFFDNVPGGAGHVKRIIKDDNFIKSLRHTLQLVESCQCGGDEGDASCYGCLRNYSNQYCHDELKRSMVIDFVKKTL